jgi:hypothetical protein
VRRAGTTSSRVDRPKRHDAWRAATALNLDARAPCSQNAHSGHSGSAPPTGQPHRPQTTFDALGITSGSSPVHSYAARAHVRRTTPKQAASARLTMPITRTRRRTEGDFQASGASASRVKESTTWATRWVNPPPGLLVSQARRQRTTTPGRTISTTPIVAHSSVNTRTLVAYVMFKLSYRDRASICSALTCGSSSLNVDARR